MNPPPASILSGAATIVTGATSGIGLAAASALAALGARVVPVGRDPFRLTAAMDRLRAAGSIEPGHLADLDSFAAVRRLAVDLREQVPRIDLLLLNAGGLYPGREMTVDGIEKTFEVNHLSMFLLTSLLRQNIAPGGRIIVTSSAAHRRARGLDLDDVTAPAKFSMMGAYSLSKLANILFTHELARRLAGTGILANCFHPGLIGSRFGAKPGVIGAGWAVIRPFLPTPEDGARTAIYLATAPASEVGTGGYFRDERRVEPTRLARNDALAEALWQRSAVLCGVPP